MAYMRWKDLEAEQRRDLDTKIRFAQGTIAQSLAVCRRRPAVAFSGGKDSLVLLHMVREQRPDVAVVYGNTGVEYPECVKFSRWLAAEWNLNFHEAKPGTTDAAGYRYPAQRTIWEHLVETHQIGTVLKPDGKLKSTAALEAACPPELAARLARDKRNFWPAGAVKSYFWCADQYGWPLLGKAWSLLKARRINIDTFLTFSESQSDKPKLLAYYKILRQVKISQACCDILKKEPAGRVQAGLDVDVFFKGLMAAESRSRAKNFLSRGYLFPGAAKNYLGGKDGDPFWHCNPMSTWTDDDVWAYIRRHNLPYASLYDLGYTDKAGTFHKIKRNGCMGCGTDLLFPNNHMAMLRRTHPRAWETFMRKGMAAEIQKLQQARRNGGQLSLFDVFDAEDLLDRRPCIFDTLDGLTLQDDTAGDDLGFDPEVD
jgi:3'-phosphoadenosine 5'-phosphosulfate sulfotransferase (PAPS reductase)/FAD synthetase